MATQTKRRPAGANDRRPEGALMLDASGLPFRPEIVRFDRLAVYEYQRPVKGKLVREIENDFDPLLVGTLIISSRTRGRDAIIDGQTRWVGMTRRGIDSWLGLVYMGLDLAQEADLFVRLQTKKRGLASTENFRAALIAKDPVALGIKASVESVGYEVGPANSSPRAISAVVALRRLYLREPMILERALAVFHEAWRTKGPPSGWHIRGMHRYLTDNPDVDDEKLARRLALVDPTELTSLATDAKRVGGMGNQAPVYMAAAIAGKYAKRERARA